MNNDITLPPLPPLWIVPSVEPVDYPEVAQALMDYARAAIKADRQRRGEPVQALLQQARRVRNYSDPDQVFEAVPVSAFDVETAPQPAEPVKMPSDAEILACLRPLYANDVAAAMGAEDDLRTARLLLSHFGSGQPAASTGAPEHRKLREFYSVLTDDELIVAQQHHIEKLQTKLSAEQVLLPGRVREG